MAKASSHHPIRGPRQRKMSGQAAPGRNDSRDPLPEKSVGYVEDIGKAQFKDRSLGYSRVKGATAQRGL